MQQLELAYEEAQREMASFCAVLLPVILGGVAPTQGAAEPFHQAQQMLRELMSPEKK